MLILAFEANSALFHESETKIVNITHSAQQAKGLLNLKAVTKLSIVISSQIVRRISSWSLIKSSDISLRKIDPHDFLNNPLFQHVLKEQETYYTLSMAQPRQTLECGNTSHNFGIIDIFSEKEFPVYSLYRNGTTRDEYYLFFFLRHFDQKS